MLREKRGGKMRRRCFFILILVLTLLAFIDALGIPLKPAQLPPGESEAITCTGKILRIQSKDGRTDMQIKLLTYGDKKVDFSENVLVSVYENLNACSLSRSIISFRAVLRDAPEAGNPHCFNYRKYLKSKGIGKIAAIRTFKIVGTQFTPADLYERVIYRARSEFLQSVSANARGMISGVLFGDTSLMEEDVSEEFRQNGTSHILAVSGMHVGILYGIYKKLAGRRRSAGAFAALLAMLFLYGSLAMWSTSSTRAILMIAVSTAGRYTDRRNDMLTAMSASAFILIAKNPYVIFDSGFQMSFLAITSIAFLRPVMPKVVPESLATAIAVNIGLLVYQIYSFNYFSFISIIVNIPIIYMTGYFVPAALAGFCAFTAGCGYDFLRPVVEGFALMLEKVNHVVNFGGLFGANAVSPPLFAVLFLITSTFFAASESFCIMKSRKEYKKIASVLAVILAVSAVGEGFSYSPLTHDDIIFVDVGQGDCVHIKAGGKNILIDGGGAVEYNVGKNKLKPYLLKNGVSKVDAAIATHRHTDHYKGLTELSECMKTGEIYTEMTKGKTLRISEDVYIETVWPLTLPEGSTQDENKDCSVFLIHYGRYKVLITGDLDKEGERALIKHYAGTDTLKADILKIGHHGSRTSTSPEFLSAVSPDAAVIQVGRNNYGHPSEETLKTLDAFGCVIFRNDTDGAVGISFDKKKIRIHTNS